MAKIRVGEKVSEFSAAAQGRSTIRLADYLGEKALVLCVYTIMAVAAWLVWRQVGFAGTMLTFP